MDNIDLKFDNDKALTKLFDELTPSAQNKIVIGGMRDAGKLIQKEAKRNLKARTNVTKPKEFRIKKMRSRIGVIIGVTYYKYRWLNWGSEQRSYKAKRSVHRTGKIKRTDFFNDAVSNNLDRANKGIQSSIIRYFEKTIKKYNK